MSFHTYIRVAAALVLAVGLGGCANAADAGKELPTQAGDSGDVPREANDALRELANRDIESANATYREIAATRPHRSYGNAGVAVTDTLLLPGADPIDSLVETHLDGHRVRGDVVDAQRIIYEDGGYLYWLSRGANWETRSETTGTKGIKQLIANRLPWDDDRLESLKTFSGGLDAMVEEAMPTLIDFADYIGDIETNIGGVLDSDHNFSRLVIPGETFHDRKLTLKISASELAVIAAGLAALRGALHYASAYRWDWSLQEAFITYPEERSNDERSDAWTDWDDSVRFLDSRLLRQVSAARQQQLDEAREAFAASLGFLEQAIALGPDNDDGTLKWSNVDREYAGQLREFLADLRQSLHGQTTLRHTEPETTADLSPLFEPGRTLPEGTHWFESREIETSSGTVIEWHLRDAAIQAMFVDDLFTPQFDLREDNAPELTIGGERLDTFLTNLVGPTVTDFEDVYLTR